MRGLVWGTILGLALWLAIAALIWALGCVAEPGTEYRRLTGSQWLYGQVIIDDELITIRCPVIITDAYVTCEVVK